VTRGIDAAAPAALRRNRRRVRFPDVTGDGAMPESYQLSDPRVTLGAITCSASSAIRNAGG